MKTLYIVRHAKSSWEYPSVKDIDRPLKERGINDAYLISKILNRILVIFQGTRMRFTVFRSKPYQKNKNAADDIFLSLK